MTRDGVALDVVVGAAAWARFRPWLLAREER